MDFYELEEARLRQDQKDNELIKQLIINYQSLKEIIKTSQIEREDLHAELQKMKEQNQILSDELQQLKQNNQKGSETSNVQGFSHGYFNQTGHIERIQINSPKANYFQNAKQIFNQSTNLQKQGFIKTVTGFNRTFDKSSFTQQTKRRVINGLVGQLNQELEESQELLRKQRKMQEQSRRMLQSCHEQLAYLRLTVKDLEGRVVSLSLDNEKLCRELQQALNQKGQLEQKYCLNSIQNRQYRSTLLLNMEEFEGQMDKMDAIYGQIELELQT